MTLARDERREAHDELLAQARYYESARVGGTLVIFAYAHHQRAADYWTQRLDG